MKFTKITWNYKKIYEIYENIVTLWKLYEIYENIVTLWKLYEIVRKCMTF